MVIIVPLNYAVTSPKLLYDDNTKDECVQCLLWAQYVLWHIIIKKIHIQTIIFHLSDSIKSFQAELAKPVRIFTWDLFKEPLGRMSIFTVTAGHTNPGNSISLRSLLEHPVCCWWRLGKCCLWSEVSQPTSRTLGVQHHGNQPAAPGVSMNLGCLVWTMHRALPWARSGLNSRRHFGMPIMPRLRPHVQRC